MVSIRWVGVPYDRVEANCGTFASVRAWESPYSKHALPYLAWIPGLARLWPAARRTEKNRSLTHMNISKTQMLIAMSVGLFISGCNKYDDGPSISFRSREERIANNWRVESAKKGTNDVTSSFTQYELRLTKDRDAALQADYELGSLTFSFQTTGSWDFENNDEDLRLDFEDNAADDTYEILRLKEDELWLREKGDDLELHLVPN